MAPVLVVLVLRLPVISQLDYADAWFYSGYAWTPKHHFDDFGFTYFAVRFPAVIAIGLFEKLLGAQAGYLLLRYLLAVLAGAALYGLARRFTRPAVALGTVLLLLLNPFFSRELLWDYSYFLAVAGGVIGVALWFWSEGRPRRWTVLAGAALGVAAFSHATFVTLLLVLGVVEAVAALRARAFRRLAVRGLLALLGVAIVFLLGYVVYVVLLGGFSPYEMLRPTVDFLRNNDEEVRQYVIPPDLWLWHSPRIWPPVVLSVALIAVMGRDVLGRDLQARIAQLCIGFTAFVWLYRFTRTSSFIEAWWSYDMTVIVMAPAVAVVLHRLADRVRRDAAVVVGAVAATAAAAVLLRWADGLTDDLYTPLNRDGWRVGLLLAVTVVCALLLAARNRRVVLAALVAFAVAGVVMTYSIDVLDGRGGTATFARDGGRDWTGYAAGHRFAEYVRDHERGGEQVYLWYPSGVGDMDIAWVDLPQTGQTVQALGQPVSFAGLDPLGVSRLQAPQARRLLVMSPVRADLAAARKALTGAGFATVLEDRGDWFGKGRLPYVLLRLTAKP